VDTLLAQMSKINASLQSQDMDARTKLVQERDKAESEWSALKRQADEERRTFLELERARALRLSGIRAPIDGFARHFTVS